MTGLEYIRTVCYTTKVGRDPLREDVSDAFEDGVAEGWKQHKESQWKPSDEQIEMLENVRKLLHANEDIYSKANNLMYSFEELIRTLKKLREE